MGDENSLSKDWPKTSMIIYHNHIIIFIFLGGVPQNITDLAESSKKLTLAYRESNNFCVLQKLTNWTTDFGIFNMENFKDGNGLHVYWMLIPVQAWMDHLYEIGKWTLTRQQYQFVWFVSRSSNYHRYQLLAHEGLLRSHRWSPKLTWHWDKHAYLIPLQKHAATFQTKNYEQSYPKVRFELLVLMWMWYDYPTRSVVSRGLLTYTGLSSASTNTRNTKCDPWQTQTFKSPSTHYTCSGHPLKIEIDRMVHQGGSLQSKWWMVGQAGGKIYTVSSWQGKYILHSQPKNKGQRKHGTGMPATIWFAYTCQQITRPENNMTHPITFTDPMSLYSLGRM